MIQMQKKLSLTSVALVAFFALVIAPAAPASPVLTENGVALSVGTSVTGISTLGMKFTGGFGVECEVGSVNGTVTKNTGTEIASEVPVGSAMFTNAGGAECSSSFGLVRVKVTSKLCMATIPKTDNVTITGCGSNPVTFDLTVFGFSACRYSTATIAGTFTTGSNPATVNVSGAPASEEEPRTFFCPDTGSLDFEWEMYTTNGTPVPLS